MYDEPPEPTDEMVEHEQQQAVMRAPTVRIDGITAEAVRNGSQEHASAPAAPEPEAPQPADEPPWESEEREREPGEDG